MVGAAIDIRLQCPLGAITALDSHCYRAIYAQDRMRIGYSTFILVQMNKQNDMNPHRCTIAMEDLPNPVLDAGRGRTHRTSCFREIDSIVHPWP